MKTQRIPQEVLDAAWRSFTRRAAAALCYAMAEADADFAFISKRTGDKEKDIRKYFLSLVEGTNEDECRGFVDMATALGCRLIIQLHPLKNEVVEEEAVQEPAEEAESDDGDDDVNE